MTDEPNGSIDRVTTTGEGLGEGRDPGSRRNGQSGSKRDRRSATALGEIDSGTTDGRDRRNRTGDDDHTTREADRLAGSKGPFQATYRDGERIGWYCSNCGSIDVAMGPMGRAQCDECDNVSKPTERDRSYL